MLKSIIIGLLAALVVSGCGAPSRPPLDLATATTAPAVAPILATTPTPVPSPAEATARPTDPAVPPTVTSAPPTVTSGSPTATVAVATAVPVTPTPATTPSVVTASVTVSPSANSGEVKVVSVSTAKPGAVINIAAQAGPNALCSITITTPKGKPISAKSLAAKTTDSNGQVTWSWKVPARTVVGTGSVAVACGPVSATAPLVIG